MTDPAPGVRGKAAGEKQSGSRPHGAYNLVVEKDREPHKCKVEMPVSVMKKGTGHSDSIITGIIGGPGKSSLKN